MKGHFLGASLRFRRVTDPPEALLPTKLRCIPLFTGNRDPFCTIVFVLSVETMFYNIGFHHTGDLMTNGRTTADTLAQDMAGNFQLRHL
jgi:hypothetical protein